MKAILAVLIPVSIATMAGVASAAEPAPPEAATPPVGSTSVEGPSMNHSLSAFLGVGYGFGYGTGFGVGGRYQFILVPDGFINSSKIRDEFGLEVGLDFFHVGWSSSVGTLGDYSYSYNEFTPVVGAVWNFWLSDKFAIYPKIDLGYHIGSVSATIGGQSVDASGIAFSALYFQGTGGVIYRVGDAIDLRAEAGWSTLHLGAAITL
jgi:hypothetical protein